MTAKEEWVEESEWWVGTHGWGGVEKLGVGKGEAKKRMQPR